MDVEMGISKFDLHLELDNRPEGLLSRFIYSTEIFDRSTIVNMRKRWVRLLERISKDSSEAVQALAKGLPGDCWSGSGLSIKVHNWRQSEPVVLARTFSVMCAEVNVSREFHCREGLGAVHTISIQNVFEQRAAQCPDSTAIISPLGDWSYTRLRSYANHVATRLRKEGVRPGSLVGVCAASTPETIGCLPRARFPRRPPGAGY